MKKGDRVYIEKNAQKGTPRMNGWTESCLYGEEILPAGTILYHISIYDKITAFAPVETCFTTKPITDGYVYAFILKKDLKFRHVDIYEYRYDLNSNDDFEIFYLGTIGRTNKAIVDKYNRIVEKIKKISFAKEFKNIEKEIETRYKREIDEMLNGHNAKIYGYKLVDL